MSSSQLTNSIIFQRGGEKPPTSYPHVHSFPIFNSYPLVNIQKNDGKSPFLMAKSTINGNFHEFFCMFTRGDLRWLTAKPAGRGSASGSRLTSVAPWSDQRGGKAWINGLPSGELTFCHGKSPFLMGKSTILTGPFSIAMWVHQRVPSGCVWKCCVMVLLIIIPIKWLFHWEYTQHFQTNPSAYDIHSLPWKITMFKNGKLENNHV